MKSPAQVETQWIQGHLYDAADALKRALEKFAKGRAEFQEALGCVRQAQRHVEAGQSAEELAELAQRISEVLTAALDANDGEEVA